MRLGLAGVLAPVLLVPFALIAVFVAGGWAPLRNLDASVAATLHSFSAAHPLWVDVMVVWSWVFAPMSLRVAALIVVIWLAWRHHAPRLAVWVVVTMAVGGIIAALLKFLVGRDRPDLLDPVARAAGYSFPSGHAANAALTAGVFLLVFLPFVRDRPGRRAALWAAVIVIPLLTGVFRIGLGVHWASDVFCGWLLGVATVAATTVAFQRWRIGEGRAPAPATVEGVEPEIAHADVSADGDARPRPAREGVRNGGPTDESRRSRPARHRDRTGTRQPE